MRKVVTEVTNLVGFVNAVEDQKGRYLRRMLTILEQNDALDQATRKVILDGLNDYTRSIYTLVGYEIER